jgi:hypothetical protein
MPRIVQVLTCTDHDRRLLSSTIQGYITLIGRQFGFEQQLLVGAYARRNQSDTAASTK